MSLTDYPLFCDPATAQRRARAGQAIFGNTPQGRAKLRAGSGGEVRRFIGEYGRPGCFLMFIAWPRSGHSLLGALLDAHPEMAIAHELHACGWFEEGVRPDELFYFCWQNARHHGLMGRRWREYDYSLAGQWQGRVRQLKVLGDKKGGETSLILSRYPQNLVRIRRRLGEVPLRLIHAVRHPLDNIATMWQRWPHAEFRQIHDAIERYRRCADANARVLEEFGDAAITVWHEDLIAAPRRQLQRLAHFLGVTADDAWLDACCAAVRTMPHRSRDDVRWSASDLAAVRALTEQFSFLERYGSDLPGAG